MKSQDLLTYNSSNSFDLFKEFIDRLDDIDDLSSKIEILWIENVKYTLYVDEDKIVEFFDHLKRCSINGINLKLFDCSVKKRLLYLEIEHTNVLKDQDYPKIANAISMIINNITDFENEILYYFDFSSNPIKVYIPTIVLSYVENKFIAQKINSCRFWNKILGEFKFSTLKFVPILMNKNKIIHIKTEFDYGYDDKLNATPSKIPILPENIPFASSSYGSRNHLINIKISKTEENMLKFEEEVNIDIELHNYNVALIYNLVSKLDIKDKYHAEITSIIVNETKYIPEGDNSRFILLKWYLCKFLAKYTSEEFKKEYNNIVNSVAKHTIKTLYFILRKEKKEDLNKILLSSNEYRIMQILLKCGGKITHGAGAEICGIFLKHKLICVPINKREWDWYHFIDNNEQDIADGDLFKWRKRMQPMAIKEFVDLQLPQILEKYKRIINISIMNISPETKEEEANSRKKYQSDVMKNIKSSMLHIQNDAFEKGVINKCGRIFNCNTFIEDLDKNGKILGVANGILLLGAKCELITTYHDYKISKSTKTKYIPYGTNPENDAKVKMLEQTLKDLYLEEDAFKFHKYYFCEWLDNEPKTPFIYFCLGGGSNGKTTFSQFMINALGSEYARAGEPGLLTGTSKDPNGHKTAFLALAEMRGFVFNETNKGQVFESRMLKCLADGNVEQTGRVAHSADQRSFTINGRNKIDTNNNPIINDIDYGVWRRILFYRHKITFLMQELLKDKDPRLFKLKNKDIMDKWTIDIDYLNAFLTFNVMNYEDLKTSGKSMDEILQECPTMVEGTKEFRRECDRYYHYFTRYLVKSTNSEINITTLANSFYNWCKSYSNRPTNIKEVEDEIKNNSVLQSNVDKTGKFVKGYRLWDFDNDVLAEGEVMFS